MIHNEEDSSDQGYESRGIKIESQSIRKRNNIVLVILTFIFLTFAWLNHTSQIKDKPLSKPFIQDHFSENIQQIFQEDKKEEASIQTYTQNDEVQRVPTSQSMASSLVLNNDFFPTTPKHTFAQRVKIEKPISKERSLKVAIFSLKDKQQMKKSNTCAILNSVTLLTEVAITSALNLMSLKIDKFIIFFDASDDLTQKVRLPKISNTQYALEKQKIVTDSDYLFLRKPTADCKKVAYLQNNFEVTPEGATSLLSQLSSIQEHSMEFSLKAKAGFSGHQKQIELKDLTAVDLDQGLLPAELNQYVFLFDPAFLSIITPLNFAFYNKYTIQEMIIYPIIALLQHSSRLRSFNKVVHGFDKSVVQFKEFVLSQPQTDAKDMSCFLSFPNDPSESLSNDLQPYIDKLSQVKGRSGASVVIFAPYRFKSTESLWEVGKQLINSRDFPRLRLRIRGNQTVSSLGVYESAYTYCPENALIISSRRNIDFSMMFLQKLNQQLVEKQHIYFISFEDESNHQTTMPLTALRKIRDPNTFKSYFSNLQIFRSNLLQMVYFHILKCKQIDFYETQASFIFPMLQMTRSVKIIDTMLYQVRKRSFTKTEERQINNLKDYLVWDKVGRVLQPFQYNSLENVAFRRFAPEIIPRKIHQIWIGDHNISEFRLALLDTLKQHNPDFKFYLWQNQHLTVQNFPYTYSLIWRSLEYQKDSDRSYSASIAALIRYQLLLRHGGIYMDFKIQCRKSLVPFLKYEIFFPDSDYDPGHNPVPRYVGNPIIGSIKNSYYLQTVLTQIIFQESFDYNFKDFPKLVGGYALRKAFSDKELFTVPGLGFQLFSQKPGTGLPNLCSYQKSFSSNQKIYQVKEYSTGKVFKIGLPCDVYEQAYLVIYKIIGRTWKGTKKQLSD